MIHDTSATDQEFNLALVLNILWRRRLIVLGLPALGLLLGILYGIFGTRRWEATLTIRPGITAFDPSGGPHRQWQLKDITRWYEKQMFRRELVDRLDLGEGARPVIRAEFIAQGLQNLQGGDVITLWTTSTSPELAASMLDTSVVLFNDYAEADTVSSQLKLTRDGLLLQVSGLQTQLLAMDKQEATIQLRLQQARADSLVVVAEELDMAIELDKLDGKIDFCERRVLDLQEEAPLLREDLTRLDHTLRRLAAGADAGTEADEADVPGWAHRNAVLNTGDVIEGLTLAKLQLQRALARNRSSHDSLSYTAAMARLDRAQLEVQREVTIRAKISEVAGQIGDLHLERDYDVPAQRRDLHNQIAERTVKLGTIAPLQRVGGTVVSDDPVRPRTLRAIVILMFLGVAGGLVLAFGWDYVIAHRREIFRS